MKIAIIDDNICEAEATRAQILEFFPTWEITVILNLGLLFEVMENSKFDLILSEISLGENNGYRIVRMIKMRFPDVRVVIYTRVLYGIDSYLGFKAGVDDIFIKSIWKKERCGFLDYLRGIEKGVVRYAKR